MYWPKDGIETYGIIQVKLVQEDVMATYTVRTFVIKHLKLAKKNKNATEKTVYQYHYTNWPDHGEYLQQNRYHHHAFHCSSRSNLHFIFIRYTRSSIARIKLREKVIRCKST